MKRFILLLCIILFTARLAEAQKDSTVQKLIDNQLLSQEQSKEFLENLNRINKKLNHMPSSYLLVMFWAEFKKATGHDYEPIGTAFDFESYKPTETEQQEINQKLWSYILKLKNSNVISETVYKEWSLKIARNEYVDILQVLPELSYQAEYREWFNTNDVLEYGEKLVANQIMSKEYFEQFKKDFLEGRISYCEQLIPYCKHAAVFDLANYSDDPAIYLEQIHKEVSQLLPELAFTDFTYKIEVDSANSISDYIFYDVLVSLKVNGKIYKQRSFIDTTYLVKEIPYLGKIDGPEFYQIFNKILIDQASPVRLHYIRMDPKDGRRGNYRDFGIIVLDKTQSKLLDDLDGFVSVNHEGFKNSLTNTAIEEAIEKYQSIGLLSHLTEAQINAAKERVAGQNNKNLNEVLMAFPNVFYLFDVELNNLEHPYAELTSELAKISHGDFHPVNISDNFNIEKNKKATLKFKLHKKSYKKVLDIQYDWIDPDFLSFIQSVVKKNKLKGQFYELYTSEQGVQIIYLTIDQYNYLTTNKLLIFSVDWDQEEE